MTDRISLAVPAHAIPGAKPNALLESARRTLADADATAGAGRRYGFAHLAALRAAAAMVAARGTVEPGHRRAPVTSVWALLVQVAPELTEWATHFAETASTRAAVDAGIPNVVTDASAAAMVGAARAFIAVVEVSLA